VTPPAVPTSPGGSGGHTGVRPLARTRSFTRRGGRMPERHRSAYERLGPTYVVDVPRDGAPGSTAVAADRPLDPVAVFGRRAPLVVEVGSGSGDAVLAAARARPDRDFLAFEVWRPGVAQALARLPEPPPGNLRFVEADAAQALALLVGVGAALEVWTFFPDPWPKSRHHKRRLVSASFAGAVATVLSPGGLWRLATDWAAYAEHIREVLGEDERFELVSNERAPLRPVTRFERKGVVAGRPIEDLAYRRR
jgi:tRNA (guanine-N7-)-methyltransferase